ncbi:PKD domain-containing protein [Filimonas effusa]|uniref:PKD domain-containing protein n=1 Tax=Filimonas effusa TaxID=2508721 RepID=A0A4Q1DDB2_9BACT|nr:PKD domain-containing protein [Filimonas effusa]RXK86549.1 PKD domain-containing protein [Filimonas effusa]
MKLYKNIIQILCTYLCLAVTTKGYAQKPVARFSADALRGCAPLVVQFRDSSSSNTTFWQWNFGNGTISSQQNPGVIYTEPGIYTVVLVAGNTQGTDSAIRTAYIEVYGKPEVAFSANPTSGCLPMQVQFSNLSNPVSGTITSSIWDFGDGQISPLLNPQHAYTTQGNFNVSLTIQNSFGCKQVLQKNAFVQTSAKIKADFTYTYANACQSPSLIRFADKSSGASNFSYQWSFGDGDSARSASPEHTYNTAGTYPVRLIIFSENGCSDTVSQSITIGNIVPSFTLSSSGCTGKPLSFTNTSSPTPRSVTWSFGDGTTASSINATHSYTAPGVYEVKMKADFGACVDSASQSITVGSRPITAFTTAGPDESCAPVATVNFTNSSVGATGYKWFFGDGDSSATAQPAHTYQKQGYFNVTLITYNAGGCSDTLTQPRLIHIGPSRITGIANLPYSGCAPKTIEMSAITDGAQTPTSWLWNFGDGATSTEARPAHAYTTAGTYDVSVIIKTNKGCSDTFTLQQAVILAPRPVAGFSAVPPSVCGSRPFTFSDSSKGNITSWLWNFGDNATSTQQNPKHGYKDTGYYDITLIVSNNFCSDTLEKKNFVHVDAPIARFTPTLDCNSPFVRTFTDRSIAATSWEWNFGDGQTSSVPHPQHTFPAPGTYQVRLVVYNSSCNDTARATIVVADEHPSFSYTPAAPYCRKQNIRFTAADFNAANISSFTWNFGDGSSAGPGNASAVTHAYANAGNYTVSLTAKDINGCTVSTQQNASFAVYGPAAAFTNQAGACLKDNDNLVFTDQTKTDGTHALTQWTWDFGDGTVSNFSNTPFTHTYSKAGNYNVKLVVTDASGCKDSITKAQAITIADPKADFTLPEPIRCVSNDVSFRNNSQGLSLSYRWNFGDGTTATAAQPTHPYRNAGSYNVSLLVRDRFGCTDSILKNNIVTVSNPIASFSLLDTFINCPPLIARPQNTSQYFTEVKWDFDDGTTSVLANAEHAYIQGGVYQLTLIAKGYGNCTDTARKTVTVLGPSGTIQYAPLFSCTPAPVALRAATRNTQSIIWDFTDGTILPTQDSLVTHTYASYGKYTPRLILTDSFNCRVSVTGKDTLVVADVAASMSTQLQSGCDSSKMAFADASQAYNDRIKSYQWSFGDNSSTASTANTTHVYRNNGTYTVSLTVNTEKGCSKTVTQSLPIRVYSSPVVRLQAPDSTCFNNAVRFEASDIKADPAVTEWYWQYGNGQSSRVQNNTYNYPEPGIYPVEVVGRNARGCADTIKHTITVLALPSVDAGLDTSICLNVPLRLRAGGADQYTWQAHPTLSCTSCANPVATPAAGTRYHVTGRTNFGCVNYDSLFVDVKLPPNLKGYRNDSLCTGESVQFNVSGAETYRWEPATGLSNATLPNPVASPSATTTYVLTGADTKNCFSQKVNVTVAVFPIPVFHILGDSVRNLNIGYSDTLRTSSSDDINRWVWTPGNWLSCTNCPEPIISAKRDIVYTARVYNAGGCTSSDQVTVHVLCNGANIFMPNTFSPNNDGMNDQFYPRGRGLISIKSLRIFNRWGQPVFEKLNFNANSAQDGWDGNFGGKPASADVYVYIMEVVCENNTIVSYKGNIALLR